MDRDTGRALLHEACVHGRENCVRELLSYQGACDRNKPTLLGRCSPLHLAAGAGHNNVVRVLCKGGADIAARNKLGETPLHVAADKGCLDVVQLLLGMLIWLAKWVPTIADVTPERLMAAMGVVSLQGLEPRRPN